MLPSDVARTLTTAFEPLAATAVPVRAQAATRAARLRMKRMGGNLLELLFGPAARRYAFRAQADCGAPVVAGAPLSLRSLVLLAERRERVRPAHERAGDLRRVADLELGVHVRGLVGGDRDGDECHRDRARRERRDDSVRLALLGGRLGRLARA